MNKRNLALLTSKHPLLRKLTEDKTIPKSIVARLIVEEMDIEEAAANKKTAAAKSNLNTTLKKINTSDASTKEKIKAIHDFINKLKENPGAFYSKYKLLQDQQKELYDKYVSTKAIPNAENFLKELGKIQTPQTTSKPEAIKKAEEKVQNEVEAALKSEEENEEVIVDKVEQKTSQDSGEDEKYTKFVNYYKDQMKNFDGREKRALYLFTVELDTNLPKNINEDVFTTLTQGFVNLVPTDQDALLKKSIGALDKETQIALSGIVNDTQKRLGALNIIRSALDLETPQAQTEPSEPTEEPTAEPEETEGTNKKDPEPSEIPEEEKAKYVEASTNFQNEFYNQKYRIQQAKLIEDVIEAIEKIYDNPNKVAAFGRPPEEQQTVTEQQDTVEASKDELRNLRIDFRSLLSRVNKASKALNKFEELKKEGSVVTDVYKKKFIDLLKQIQASIKRIHRDLQIIIGKRGEIKEAVDTSDVMKQWKEVQEKYNKAIASSAALRELIDGTQTSEDPDKIVEDTYTALSDLATHFPSVNPFAGSEAKTTGDMKKYKNSFENAVGKVKSDLQNVLSLIKNAQSGEDTLQLAMEGLVSFSGAIQNIFGVESQFADVKVDKETPAAEGQAEEIRVVEPFANRGILKLPTPEKLSAEEKQQLRNFEEEDDKELIKKAAQIFVGTKSMDTVSLSPVEKTIAATEVRELAKDAKEPGADNSGIFDRYMGSRVPESFGLDDEQKKTLRFFKYFQSKQEKIDEQYEGTVVGGEIAKDATLLAIVNDFLDKHISLQDTWNSIMETTNAYTSEVTEEFLNYLKEPIKFSQARPIPPKDTKKINKNEPEAEELELTNSEEGGGGGGDEKEMDLSPEETDIIKATAEETIAIVKKENPEATEQEIQDKTEAEVIKAPAVQAMVSKEEDKKSVKAAVEKTVEKEVSPTGSKKSAIDGGSIDTKKKKPKPTIESIKTLAKKYSKLEAFENKFIQNFDKETAEESEKAEFVGFIGRIYSQELVKRYNEGKFDLFEKTPGSQLNQLKTMLYEKLPKELGIEIPKVYPLQQMMPFEKGTIKHDGEYYDDLPIAPDAVELNDAGAEVKLYNSEKYGESARNAVGSFTGFIEGKWRSSIIQFVGERLSKDIEEQLANKLKPLIKEMLTKGK